MYPYGGPQYVVMTGHPQYPVQQIPITQPQTSQPQQSIETQREVKGGFQQVYQSKGFTQETQRPYNQKKSSKSKKNDYKKQIKS